MAREERTNEQLEAKYLREIVSGRIRRLRALIDDIENEAGNALATAESGKGMYSSVSEAFIKNLAWGLANAGIEQMVYTSTNADVYAAENRINKSKEEA